MEGNSFRNIIIGGALDQNILPETKIGLKYSLNPDHI